jgi:SAM-dependent methyltransferase
MNYKPNQTASTENFEFEALSEAKNYRQAIVQEFSPYLQGRVLEVGAGIGQTTEELLQKSGIESITCIEPDARFQDSFRKRLPNVNLINGTAADLQQGDTFDCAIMVNVLEHICEDTEELARLHAILKPRKGYICLLVPARMEIYSKLDAHFGHFRRYNRRELARKLLAAQFHVNALYYYNFVGYFAWLLRFKINGSMCFDINQVRLFDRKIFPLLHSLESKIIRPPIGQSLIAVGQAV